MEHNEQNTNRKKELFRAPATISDSAKMVDQVLKIRERREAVFNRFPLMFTMLGAFGLVATFYGFEGVMDKTGLSENPWILLAIGLIVLVFTGTLYKKLGD